MSTLIDDIPRVVTFDFDTLPLLRSLAEGRLPRKTGQVGRFEIEIIGGNLLRATPILSFSPLERVVPFH